MNITDSIKYVGVNDHQIDLFEGQYDVPNGMAYNSYVIMDSKIAVMDAVDVNFVDEWMEHVKAATEGKEPDYLVVHHMEPDHSAGIVKFMETFANAKIVSSAKAFTMMKNFFGTDFDDRKVVVKEGDTLELGEHTLSFVAAPMVHWPEVMMSYDTKDQVAFTADAFGKFGANDVEEDWACEARRYYFGIVGKYGMQVQNVLKKISALDISIICSLHGPVLTENLGYYLDLYKTWSSYQTETEGVAIAYASVYGNTKQAALELEEALKKNGCPKVATFDLARSDMAECVEDAFRYGKIVLASVTYNADVFPCMKTFLDALTERGFQNKTIGLMENGSWAPMAAKVMKAAFEKSKNITFCENEVKITSALNEASRNQIAALADELWSK